MCENFYFKTILKLPPACQLTYPLTLLQKCHFLYSYQYKIFYIFINIIIEKYNTVVITCLYFKFYFEVFSKFEKLFFSFCISFSVNFLSLSLFSMDCHLFLSKSLKKNICTYTWSTIVYNLDYILIE